MVTTTKLFSLQGRLIVLIAVSAITVLLSGWLTFRSYRQIEQTASQNQAFTRQIEQIKSGFSERHLLLTDLRKAGSPEEFDQTVFKIQGAELTITQLLAQLPTNAENAKSSLPALELNRYVQAYHAGIKAYTDSLKAGNKASADRIAATALASDFAKVLTNLSAFQAEQNQLASTQNATLEARINSIRFWGIFTVALAMIIMVFVPYLLFNERIKVVGKIIRALDRLKKGETAKIENVQANDELGQIALGINQVSENLGKAAAFASDVGQGKFETEFEVSGDNDVLGAALVEMRDRLRAVALEEAQRNWAIAGFAQIGEILSANLDVQTFADAIISRLTQYIGATQGAFFIAHEDNNHAVELQLLSAYAYERKKYIERSFKLGEGLVGQAALEKGTIYLTDIPKNYITITSGLGEGIPSSLLVVPLLANNEMYGVLEFASFHPIERYKIEFVERLAENIAVTLNSVRNNERNLRLLQESQSLANQLAANEEEMRQNMEELAATQEEMKRVQVELNGQIAAVNNAAIVSEADLKGDIIFVNDEFCRIAKYRRDELMGQNHRILKSGHQPQEIFEDLWATISKGKVWRGVIKNKAKDGTFYWVSSTITPIIGLDQKPVKYIGVRFEITEQIKQAEQIQHALEQAQAQEEEMRQQAEELVATQEEMKRVQVELAGQVSAVNNAAIVSEADLKGDIIFVNDEFCRIAKYRRDELMGQNHRMLKSGHQEQSIFDDLWRTISRGHVWRGIIKNRAKDGTYYWVSSTITPILNAEGKPTKYVGVRFDITEQVTQAEQIQHTLEEAQAQEEEIRQNAEELAAAQEEMQRLNIEIQSNLSAINKALSVVEFDLNGNILKANPNFLRLMGYESEQISGKHHSIFVEKAYAESADYKDFWLRLKNGESFSEEFLRFNSAGKAVWIRGYYFPVLDKVGNPYKIMKFAIDITKMKEQEVQIKQALEETQAQEEEMRQQAEELLSTQEEMKRVQVELAGQISALNNAAIVSEADLRGDIIFANDQFCRISKYSREELLGNNHRILKSGHQPQEIFEELWRLISRGQVWRGVIKNRAKDGTYYWVASTITPIIGLDGKPVKYVGVRFDITEQVTQAEQIRSSLDESKSQEEEIRQQAEELLASQEEMKRTQIELAGHVAALNNAAIVSEADLKGDIIFVNDEFCRIAKYDRTELLGQNHRILKSGHQPQAIFDDLWRTISRGLVWKGIIKNRAKDGTYYWVASTITPIMGAEGKPIKYIGVRFDITSQVEQADQIKNALEKARHIEEEARQREAVLRQHAEQLAQAYRELKENGNGKSIGNGSNNPAENAGNGDSGYLEIRNYKSDDAQ
jgi:PAS domain S-box-containing protein